MSLFALVVVTTYNIFLYTSYYNIFLYKGKKYAKRAAQRRKQRCNYKRANGGEAGELEPETNRRYSTPECRRFCVLLGTISSFVSSGIIIFHRLSLIKRLSAQKCETPDELNLRAAELNL